MAIINKIIASVYPFPFSIGEGHDTNFSIIKGNRIFSCEEGKINGVVNSQCDRFPQKSILSALNHFNIESKQIDCWVFGCKKNTPEKPALEYFFSKFKAKSYEQLKSTNNIHYVSHHLAHASLAIYGSGIKDGIFLSMDNGGDEAFPYGSSWGIFDDNKVKLIGKSNKDGWGITRFHNFICETIGYLGNVDNGKVMGLAAYGSVNKELYNKLRNFLVLSKDGFSANLLLRHNPICSKPRLNKLKLDAFQLYKVLNTPNPPLELKEITKYYSTLDVAATGQKVVEDVALEIVKNIIKETKRNKLVCSGGFFQNISFNKKLLEIGLKKVYVPPAPNDAGLSLGAALYHKMSTEKNRPKKLLSPYLGPNFSYAEIENLIKDYNLDFVISKNVTLEAAKLISEGKVLGWFQGRLELGPRALGSRSVLADPRKKQNKAKVNQLLKKREWFMPYAPSIMADKMKLFFKHPISTPYMSFAFDINYNLEKIPATVHIDKTCRPQSVSKDQNPKFYNLINHFYKITGIPAVLNTSFNRHGVATIVTPRQALEHLLNGCVEVLIIEDFIVRNKKKSKNTKKELVDEEYYIQIEKIIHIIEAAQKKDIDTIQILEKNSKLVTKYKIIINENANDNSLTIKGKKIKIESLNREYLWKKLLPIL
tara:strand:+ start:317 stop:2269 length:1953 start_codon:yes stop_codon:yes gene_type:complete